jgi:transmembrane sensor
MTAPGDDEDHATIEAARWLVALEEAPDDGALRARFEVWLNASPANAAAWANTSDIYGLMARTPPAYADRWAPPAASRRRRPAWRRLTIGAAAAALAACLAFVVAPAAILRMTADYVTSTAELRALQLEDGSMVRLGPESAIDVAFDSGERLVRLLQGEAFFEVRADSERPFRVVARNVETIVLGTAFNVRLGADGAAVSVQHGRVGVESDASRPPTSERLEAGDWIRVSRGGPVDRGAMPPDEVASWLHGQIIAHDRAVADVVDELRRYFVGAIVLTDDALGDQRVTGVYNVADPVAALRAIAGVHGATVRQISPWILMISAG